MSSTARLLQLLLISLVLTAAAYSNNQDDEEEEGGDGPKYQYIAERGSYLQVSELASIDRHTLEHGVCYPWWRHPDLPRGNSSLNNGYSWVHPPPPFDYLRLAPRLYDLNHTMPCDFDVLYAANTTAEYLYEHYIRHEKPVLVRGLPVHLMPGLERWHRDRVVANYGDALFKAGHKPPQMAKRAPLRQFIEQYVEPTSASTVRAPDQHPVYLWDDIFAAWGDNDEEEDEGVTNGETATRPNLHQEFLWPSKWIRKDRSIWPIHGFTVTLGPACSGAHMHMHNAAWNIVLSGLKHWIVHHPKLLHESEQRDTYDNTHIVDFFNHDFKLIHDRPGVQQCYQQAGDMVYAPHSWYHGVVNVHTTLSIISLRADMPGATRQDDD